MFPDANYSPAHGSQSSIRISIAFLVDGELPLPPVTVGVRGDAVFWAAVPEAPVHKDSYSLPRKGDVYPTSRETFNAVLDAEPQPSSVQFLSEIDLRGGVCPLLSGETGADGRARFGPARLG